MAGLIKKNFEEEIITELSWMKSVLVDIGKALDIDSFEMELLKNSIQPEEEKAINKLIALNFKKLESLNIADRRKLLEEYFYSETQKTWTVSDDVTEKLILLRLKELSANNKKFD